MRLVGWWWCCGRLVRVFVVGVVRRRMSRGHGCLDLRRNLNQSQRLKLRLKKSLRLCPVLLC